MKKIILFTTLLMACSFGCLQKSNSSKSVGDMNPMTAYRDSTYGFANMKYQQQHENKYKESGNSWSGHPVFTGYAGWGFNQPFDLVQIMKDSSFKNFTFGFLNPGYNEIGSDNAGNLGANYLDQIQEVHSMGGNVTISFGGATSSTSFFNNDPSEMIMYQRLLDLALGYGVHSFDFDIESGHSLASLNDIQSLMTALVTLRQYLQTNYNQQLQIRFTYSYFPTGVNSVIQEVTNTWGTNNVIWNDMELTAGNNLGSVIGRVETTESSLKSCDSYAKMDENTLLHHIGVTAAIDRNEPSIYNDFYNDNINTLNNLGLLGIWSISNDHKQNSPVDPIHGIANDKNDFDITNFIQSNYENANSDGYNVSHNSAPDNVTGLTIYSQNKQYVTLKWNPSKNAQYYIVANDHGDILQQVDRTTASVSLRENPQLFSTFNLHVVACNNYGKSDDASILANTSGKIDGQIEYWDRNVWYQNISYDNNKTYESQVKYIYYQGNIYQDINTAVKGIPVGSPTPDKDIKNWKLVGKATDAQFGLSKQRIKDLQNFEWDTDIKQVAPITTFTVKTGDVVKLDPYSLS